MQENIEDCKQVEEDIRTTEINYYLATKNN